MSIIYNYLKLLKRFKGYRSSYFQEYTKFNISISKKLSFAQFRQQLTKVDPKLIQNRITQIYKQIKQAHQRKDLQNSNSLIKEKQQQQKNQNSINFKLSPELQYLYQCIKQINMSFIQAYASNQEKSVINNDKAKINQTNYKLFNNSRGNINWLFHTRQQIYFDQYSQIQENKRPRSYYLANIPTYDDAQLKFKLKQQYCWNQFLQINDDLNSQGKLLLFYDLQKHKNFNNQIFYQLQSFDKTLRTVQRIKLMKKLVNKIIPFQNYCKSFFQYTSLKKILIMLSTFGDVTTKLSWKSRKFWNEIDKLRTILFFIDAILQNRQIQSPNILQKKQQKELIFNQILFLMQYIISKIKFGLKSIKLIKFIEILQTFNSIKQKLNNYKSIINLYQINNAKMMQLQNILIKIEQFVLPQEFLFKLDLNFDLRALTYKQKDMYLGAAFSKVLIKFIDYLLIKRKYNTNFIFQFLSMLNNYIQLNEIDLLKQFQQIYIIETENIQQNQIFQQNTILTSQLAQKLNQYIFKSTIHIPEIIQVKYIIKFLWIQINRQKMESLDSVVNFIYFFMNLPKCKFFQFYDYQISKLIVLLSKSVSMIFKLRIVTMMDNQFGNLLLTCVKLLFRGKELNSAQLLLNSYYQLK